MKHVMCAVRALRHAAPAQPLPERPERAAGPAGGVIRARARDGGTLARAAGWAGRDDAVTEGVAGARRCEEGRDEGAEWAAATSVGAAGWAAGARSPAAPAAVEAGARLGPYRLGAQIGVGGMSTVFRAQRGPGTRPAAIKVLHEGLERSPWARDRLWIEARAAGAVRHPGIVEIYGCGGCGGSGASPRRARYLAMELLEGETLAARLARGQPVPLREAIAIARQLACALAAAHERGVIHRDLKPENVFLLARGRVKVLDFGIARVASIPASYPVSEDGLVVGTPAYMAPERCLGAADHDHRADLYALGCVLFELVTGRPPYACLPPADVLVAHVRAAVPDLRAAAPVPPELARLVSRLLAKRPELRPPSGRRVAEALGEIARWAEPRAVRAPLPR
jgi:serine/threonine-protein kinase